MFISSSLHFFSTKLFFRLAVHQVTQSFQLFESAEAPPPPPPPRSSLCSVLTFAHSSLLLDFGHFNCGLCPCIFFFVAVCARRGFQIRCSARISPLGLWVIDAQPTQGCVLLLCFIRLDLSFKRSWSRPRPSLTSFKRCIRPRPMGDVIWDHLQLHVQRSCPEAYV